MRIIRSVLIPILLMLLITAVIGCDGEEQPFTFPTQMPDGGISGELPILKTGDKWVARVISEGVEHTMTVEVTGEDVTEGKDCYVIVSFFDPPAQDIIGSVTGKIYKATMDTIRMETSGEYMGSPYSLASSYSYQYTGPLQFPLEVGKEFEVIETETSNFTLQGDTDTETITNIYNYKVESVEEVVVPAGVFKCFKVVQYDEQGTSLGTEWMSPETKFYTVKELDHETGDVLELTSYSLR